MNVKTEFSIKDLENLSGVKAHTIRIWEKRYQLLKPNRTDTNIRKYNLNSLKRLLNVSFLYNDGYKISKIADLNEEELLQLIQNKAHSNQEDYALKAFKTSMFEFDNQLFNITYKKLLEQKTFSEIFEHIFIPLLNEIGLLWQTGTIDPVHESYISELIKQKIIINIALKQQSFTKSNDKIFVLFLPFKEVHDIGLHFANYELTNAGFKTIYLGSNIPLNNLKNLLSVPNQLIFLTYLTVQPEDQDAQSFIKEFMEVISLKKGCKLWTMGPKARQLNLSKLPEGVKVISNLNEFHNSIGDLNIS